MTTGLKFGITAFVVIGVVAVGFYLHKKRQEKATAASPAAKAKPTGKTPSNVTLDLLRGLVPDADLFATNADGSIDYSHRKDGSKVPLT